MSDPSPTSPHVIIAGEIDVPPDRRDACLAAIAELQLATRRDEPGCLAYVFSADPVTPGRIVVYERWESAESLLAHFQHPNYHATRQQLGAFGLTGATVERFRVDAAAPVYDPDGVARVDRWPTS